MCAGAGEVTPDAGCVSPANVVSVGVEAGVTITVPGAATVAEMAACTEGVAVAASVAVLSAGSATAV